MKSKWVICVFLVFVAVAIRLPAQQSDAGRKLFEDTKAKAEKGDVKSQATLGEIYAFGWLGQTKDRAESLKWYRKAAAGGDPEAQSNLGFCYFYGEGVVKDYVEAAIWYRKAAKQGYASAQVTLGVCYRDGLGLPKDTNEAARWFQKSAEQGDEGGELLLGGCYFFGDGLTQSSSEALKWFTKAAQQGSDQAQFNLGLMYARGDGVLKNYIEADRWFNLASAQGNEPAKKYLTAIEQSMTQEQIAQAQELARAFKPHKNPNSGNPISPDNPIATGTGFFITDDGYLISNYHVVKDATKVRLVASAGLIDAKVVSVDAANDLALLKAEGKFSPLPIAASRMASLGSTVATVGFPNIGLQGFSPKLAKGEIASLSGASDDPRYFQISVPVQPGNSGGALVDERGNVIGIVSAKLDASVALAASGALPENVNYAVKSSFLLSFLESVPDVSAELKAPNTADEKFSDVVKSAQQAAVLVLVY